MIELYNGDCLEILPTLESGSVDAVVTDPPYGIGFKYSTYVDTAEGYGEWLLSIIEKCEILCNESSPVFVWQAMLNAKMFALWFPRDWRIFCAAKNFVQMRPTPMQYSYDPVLVWWTDGVNKPYSRGDASRDFHIANTANTMNRKDNDSGGHPCARPLDQVTHIIDQWVKPGGTVIDPFMGSGTTGVACVKTGRNFIGVELDPGYFAIAKRRIEKAQLQQRFDFTGAKEEQVQHELFGDIPP